MNRTHSLKRHKEFNFTYRVGKKQSCKSFVLVYAKNHRGEVHVGFSVSKKIGNSVMRNRSKRRLRACFEPLFKEIKGGYNLIFIARDASLSCDFAEMQNDMRTLIKKAGLMEERG
ncbi:MAG: ribonuclease P protein component [Clostridia bacterium]|nr:ribonuclease P protein component [Clostridia bacterium]